MHSFYLNYLEDDIPILINNIIIVSYPEILSRKKN